MSLLAHLTYATHLGDREARAARRELDRHIQHEIREAKRIQAEIGCSWDEALRLAYQRFPPEIPKHAR